MCILQEEYLQVTTVDFHVAEEGGYNFNQDGFGLFGLGGRALFVFNIPVSTLVKESTSRKHSTGMIFTRSSFWLLRYKKHLRSFKDLCS